METMDGFSKSLDELLQFGDSLKLREKEIEQQHNLEIESLKRDFEFKLQMEKMRADQFQEMNRSLAEQIERSTQKQVDLEHKYTVLLAKYNCCIEESKQIKELHNDKKNRIEELERITRILTDQKMKLDNEIKQLKLDNENLENKLKQMPLPATTTQEEHVPNEVVQLIEKAVEENKELTKTLTERNSEIQRLNEQLKQTTTEDPQVVEQRLLQSLAKLKNDFATMYKNQSEFFHQKLDILKQEQRDNIANLYKH